MSRISLPSPLAPAATDPAAALAQLQNLAPNRRGLLLAPLLAALPAGLLTASARGDRSEPDPGHAARRIYWKGGWGRRRRRILSRWRRVFGSTDKPGPYVVLVRWYPGFMSAPHTYVTDRLCFVISGTWWVNSGAEFRAGEHRAGARRRLRAPRRAHAALRRREEGRQGARRHRHFRPRRRSSSTHRSVQAAGKGGLG